VGVLHVLVMLMQLLVLNFVDMPSSVVQDCGGNQGYHIQHGYQQEWQPATHASITAIDNCTAVQGEDILCEEAGGQSMLLTPLCADLSA